jgi:flagellin
MRNLNDGISYINVAEGAINELKSITLRQQELASQSANGVYSNAQRLALNREGASLTAEYNRIVNTTSFNGLKIFEGDSRALLTLQAGYGQNSTLSIDTVNLIGKAKPTGEFASHTTITNSNYFTESRLADIDNDGDLDLIGGRYGQGLAISLNQGGGNFTAITYTGGDSGGAKRLTLGDFNEDGILDALALSDQFFEIRYYQGLGNGTFQPSSATNIGFNSVGRFHDLATGDFNGDGNLDYAVSTDFGSINTVLHFGQGNGTFSGVLTLGVNAHHQAVGDLNNDGRPDLVGVSGLAGSGAVNTFISSGATSFGYQDSSTAGQNTAVVRVLLADGNNDGNLDGFVRGITNSYFLAGDGAGNLAGPVLVASNFLVDSIADINGDGFVDLVTNNRVAKGNGNGTFSNVTTFSNASGFDARIGDVTGDGVLDIVTNDGFNIFVSAGIGFSSAQIEDIDLTSRTGSLSAITTLTARDEALSVALGKLGVFTSRIETAKANISIKTANYAAAESRIRDLDISSEMAKLTATSIIQQSASSLIRTHNLSSELVLSLLP